MIITLKILSYKYFINKKFGTPQPTDYNEKEQN